jgi:Uma2 family endonuclease
MMNSPAPPIAEHERLLSLDEYVRLYDAEGPLEIINGEIVKLSPNLGRHILTLGAVYRPLLHFVEAHQLGVVFPEATFALVASGQWVLGSRQPDVSFYTQARWDAYLSTNPDFENNPITLIPDLVVEVVSKNDAYSDVEGKVRLYLQDGVKVVWVVDTKTRTAHIRSGTLHLTLSLDDSLTAPDLLPGFELPLATVFAG